MCNCCSETKKKDKSELGIPACEGNSFSRRIFSAEDLREMDDALMGITLTVVEEELFPTLFVA